MDVYCLIWCGLSVCCVDFPVILFGLSLVWYDVDCLFLDMMRIVYSLIWCGLYCLIWCGLSPAWYDVDCLLFDMMWIVYCLIWCGLSTIWYDVDCLLFVCLFWYTLQEIIIRLFNSIYWHFFLSNDFLRWFNKWWKEVERGCLTKCNADVTYLSCDCMLWK